MTLDLYGHLMPDLYGHGGGRLDRVISGHETGDPPNGE
jgi:hypothetical protein